jgi:hypothetical protein
MARTKKPFDRAKYVAAKTLAADVTGYKDTNPIWKKQMPELLEEIATALEKAKNEMDQGYTQTAGEYVETANAVVQNLRLRSAYHAIISANMD